MLNNTILNVTCILSMIHWIAQIWENQSIYKVHFKYNGEVPNRITGSLFNTYLVFATLANIYKSYREDSLFIMSDYTREVEHSMVGYFVYDTLFMVLSSSRMYYLNFIIHHIVSMSMIIVAYLNNSGNNLVDNSLIFLLEVCTPLLNISKITGYIDQSRKGLQRVTKGIYFTTRVIMLFLWIIISPHSLTKVGLPESFVYSGAILVFVTSLMWYRKM